jgi:hypothetical protein
VAEEVERHKAAQDEDQAVEAHRHKALVDEEPDGSTQPGPRDSDDESDVEAHRFKA